MSISKFMSTLTICNAFLTDVITEHAQFFSCACYYVPTTQANLTRLEDVIISISTVACSRSNLHPAAWYSAPRRGVKRCLSMNLNQIWVSFLSTVKIVINDKSRLKYIIPSRIRCYSVYLIFRSIK